MGGFGSIWHWVIVLLVVVLLFGAKRIPELAKGLGSGIKNFKKAVREDDDEEEAEELLKPAKAVAAPKKPRVAKTTSTKTKTTKKPAAKAPAKTEKKATKTTSTKTTRTRKTKES